MTNFKFGTAAAAILAASAFPALAQETQATETTTGIAILAGTVIPDEHILLQFTNMADEGFFVVSFEDAAQICGITEPQFAEIAENASTGVIYCEELQQAEVRNTFIEEGRIVRLTDFEDADNDDDGGFGDDAQETAVDEAADQAVGENDDRNEPFDDDDVEVPEDNDDGLDGVDDSASE